MAELFKVSVQEFAANCTTLINEVKEKKIEILITGRNQAVAKVVAPDDEEVTVFGCMKDSLKITGDVMLRLNGHLDNND